MASNAISDITDEFLVCQVCLEDFKQPKMLPCLHTFCQSCLERLLATEPAGKLDCPTCRQDVALPRNGVQGLKSNFLVGKLHDILQQQPQQQPKGETSEAREDGVPCTVCEVGNSAQFYCLDCTDYLCQSCNKVHRGLKMSRIHKVVTVQDLQSGKAASELRARETSKCEDHQELNKFYCDTCHRVICLHCVVTAHKDHQYVEIEKAAEREGAKIKAKRATVKNTADLHQNWIQDLQSVKDEWSSEVQRAEEQIRKQVNSIMEAAKKVGNDRIAQLRAMNAAREKQLQAAMEAAEMDLASARSCVQFTDNVLEYGSPAELMSVAGELTGRLDQTADERRAGKAEMTKDLVNLTVEPSTYDVEQEVSKLVGEITKTAIQMLSSPPTITTQVRHNVVIGKGDRGLKRIKVAGKDRFGQFQCLTSLAVTAEGDIVATDYGSCLQFLGKDGSFKKKVDLRFKPECVAALTNGELLVAGDGHRIHVLDKQGRESRVIQVTGAAETGRTTQGVAVDGLGHIIVTIGHQVFKLSPGGDVMMRIGGEGQGQQNFGPILRVAVNSRNQIIVSDCHNNKMMMFDPSGRHLFTCGSHGSGPGQLHGPDCVITDSEDDIIVADFWNQRVSLFSRDGTFIRHVLTKTEQSLRGPMGLAVTCDGHLIVSESKTINFFLVVPLIDIPGFGVRQWLSAGGLETTKPLQTSGTFHRDVSTGVNKFDFAALYFRVKKMASNAISDITDEFLVCQVCLEDFKQPKMLPCLHTFCQPCLEKLLTTEPVGKLDCPTCRQDVSLPQNGVQGLKSNFLVGKLHDILQQQPQQQPKGATSEAREDGVPCTVCEVGNSATFYCVECTDYLCQTCNKVHSGLKMSRAHKVVTIQDLQSGKAASELRARETSKCEDHQELNKFYCDTCHRVICLHCVVTAHKDHQYVEIEKASEREGANIKAKLAKVKNTADLHQNWIQDLQSVKDEWSSEVQRAEEQIRKQVNSIMEAAKKVGNDRIAQLRAMNAAREKQIEAAMEAAEMDLASAGSCVQFTDNVLEYGSPAEVLSVAGELTGRLDQTADEKTAGKAEMTKDLVNLTVEPSTYNVEKEVSKLVGEITKTLIPMLSSPPTLTTQVRPNMVIGKDDGGLKRIKVVGEDRDGQFELLTSLAVTAEEDIVATDLGNSRLYFLGKDGSFKKKADLKFKPLCVAALTNGELLVTGDGHRIHVLDKQGRESRVIQVTGAEEKDGSALGIAVDGLGRIIVTIGHQVFKLSPSGDVMMRIGGKDQGQYFGSILRVAVNSRNQIIVSDWDNNKMMVFDPSGRRLFTCGSLGSGPGQLYSPYCVITDSEDNIIVSDCNNNRVSLFSRDGTFIRHVLTETEHSLDGPMGLALTCDGHLIVSESKTINFFL
ncbi:uncharacterized protein LOC144860952 [Branchiostoma floridae x Branchiostoma japonicum]